MARVRALAPHHLVHDDRNNTNSISTSCIPNSFFIIPIATKYGSSSRRRRRRRICCKYEISKTPSLELEQAGEGGKMVVELVGAFNHITHRMSTTTSDTPSTSSSIILFNALKLSLPLLHSLSNEHNSNRSLRRSPLASAFSVALLLADLRMDAEVISAALLFPAVAASAISLPDVRRRLHSPATAHLLHDSLRLSTSPLLHKHEHFEFDGDGDGDDSSSAALRKFYLKHFDSRALVLHLALKLDSMRHLHYLPRYNQQLLSLQVLRIYAPLAHALSLPLLSLELEDLAFRSLFPYSYLYLEAWLRSHDTLDDDDDGGGDGDGGDQKRPLIQVFKEELLHSLKSDPLMSALVDDISVQGRYKSRYSTMRKILRDGRRPDQVYDVLGLRVVLRPRDQQYNDNDNDNDNDKNDNDDGDAGERACYRVGEIVRSLWKEVPHRTKDYIANPKLNGYRSLHMAVDVSENGRRRPLMEIQIRTEKMDLLAVGGTASHSLYKAGLTDPQEAKRLKAIMVAAAELAALRLQDLPSTTSHKGIEIDRRDRVFRLLDKNGDGRISIEELMEVMEELGAPGEDAREMMQLLDSNSDGSLSSEEFDLFQKQVDFIRNLEDRDDQYKMMLNEKLQIAENSGSVQVYTEGPGSSLGNN
ncbi:GTP pyrophosphokinase [Morus notabilis]|uniref:GTP pyrophosphokinase n=2 Tax=Morus notabilis TaxID=981085 RepID=W9R855_9ROSA|nr:GTP pyrophosphokinase [Morus notabilis]